MDGKLLARKIQLGKLREYGKDSLPKDEKISPATTETDNGESLTKREQLEIFRDYAQKHSLKDENVGSVQSVQIEGNTIVITLNKGPIQIPDDHKMVMAGFIYHYNYITFEVAGMERWVEYRADKSTPVTFLSKTLFDK